MDWLKKHWKRELAKLAVWMLALPMYYGLAYGLNWATHGELPVVHHAFFWFMLGWVGGTMNGRVWALLDAQG